MHRLEDDDSVVTVVLCPECAPIGSSRRVPGAQELGNNRLAAGS